MQRTQCPQSRTMDATIDAKRVRRRSAGGMALHSWDQVGKFTTIHCIYELAGPVKYEAVCAAVDKLLLTRFPRFRGHVDPFDENFWVIPPSVDPNDYVEEFELPRSEGGPEAALLAHMAEQMRIGLPKRRSWQVQILRRRGGSPCLLWRIAHTLADGVVIAQIMSHVLCEPLDSTPAANSGGVAAAAAAEAPPRAAAAASATTASAAPRLAPSLFERLCAFVRGVCFVALLPFWPQDSPTPLRLGGDRWARLSPADATTRVALAPPVPVARAKAAAARLGVTVNDVLMAALAGGLRSYLAAAPAAGGGAGSSLAAAAGGCGGARLTSVVVVNPRPQAPQAAAGDGGATSPLLRQYAQLQGPGCDITLGFLPLPCAAAEPAARLRAVAESTRRLKISPELPLARCLANCLHFVCGVKPVMLFYSYVLKKFSVCAPERRSNAGRPLPPLMPRPPVQTRPTSSARPRRAPSAACASSAYSSRPRRSTLAPTSTSSPTTATSHSAPPLTTPRCPSRSCSSTVCTRSCSSCLSCMHTSEGLTFSLSLSQSSETEQHIIYPRNFLSAVPY